MKSQYPYSSIDWYFLVFQMEISSIQIPTLLTIKLSKNKIKPPMFLLTFLINIIEFDHCIAYIQ